MRSIFFLLLVISACRSGSQNNNHPPAVAPVSKKIDTIHSKILNEDRFIWIRVPETDIPAYLSGEFGIVNDYWVIDNTVWFGTAGEGGYNSAFCRSLNGW